MLSVNIMKSLNGVLIYFLSLKAWTGALKLLVKYIHIRVLEMSEIIVPNNKNI